MQQFALSECGTATAGQGWVNTATPGATGTFTAAWRAYPSAELGAGPIDALVGLSSQAATQSADLAATVRFSPSGSIDANDGTAYGGWAFPYTFGEGGYDFRLLIDVPQARYSAWVRRLDSPYKPFELLAGDFAFRPEQANAAQLANVGVLVDSAHGSLETCSFAQDPPDGCVVAGPRTWQSRPLALLGLSTVKLDFHAWVDQSGIDAVIGAARNVPARFSDLAAIVRFRPDGYLDVRNGGAYAADRAVPYEPETYYRFTFEIDTAQSTYSVIVSSGVTSTVLARDYRFRTEQVGVTELAHLGQFVDAGSGSVHTCAVVGR